MSLTVTNLQLDVASAIDCWNKLRVSNKAAVVAFMVSVHRKECQPFFGQRNIVRRTLRNIS